MLRGCERVRGRERSKIEPARAAIGISMINGNVLGAHSAHPLYTRQNISRTKEVQYFVILASESRARTFDER